ncbi:hypothetical protein AP221_26420 [Escherichia coli]|nr:hypothetical protein AP221_26420 [Escherichia coli]
MGPEQALPWHAGNIAWRGAPRPHDTYLGIELETRGWQESAGAKNVGPVEPAELSEHYPQAGNSIGRYHHNSRNAAAKAENRPQRKADPGALSP